MSGFAGPSYDEYQATRTFGSLDGLRCLSILAVLWHHTSVGRASWLPGTFNGFLGVDLFFVISGFLITTLLLRERDTRWAISLRRFYARRSLRIFPPYYALLVVVILALLTVGRGLSMREPFFEGLPYYLTYTSNWVDTGTLFAITWSLATEEQFYLLWPPVERYLRRAVLPLLGLAILVNQLVNFRLADGFLEGVLGIRYEELPILQATFTPILLGVAIAHLLHEPRGFRAAARWLGSKRAAPLALLAVTVFANLPGPLGGWPRLAVQLSMAALVLACTIREDHHMAWLLRLRAIAYVGKISYGMYLYHLVALDPVDRVLARLGGADLLWLRFAACTGLTVGIAAASFHFFEQRFLALKRHFP